MNELTRTASKRTLLEAISFLWFGYRGKRRKFRRSPQRPLTGKPQHYLTGLECGCEPLSIHKDFDIETYSDGYSEGVAVGMTIMERSKRQLPDYKELRGIYKKPSINETGE